MIRECTGGLFRSPILETRLPELVPLLSRALTEDLSGYSTESDQRFVGLGKHSPT